MLPGRDVDPRRPDWQERSEDQLEEAEDDQQADDEDDEDRPAEEFEHSPGLARFVRAHRALVRRSPP
jgi:hypothetical protein